MQNSFPNGPPPIGFPPLVASGLLPSPYGQPPANAFFAPAGLMIAPPQALPSSASTPAPAKWVEYKTPDGRAYYFNTLTKQTVWDKPEELKLDVKQALASCPWKEYRTPEGKVYYYNTITQTSSWTLPPELEELKARLSSTMESKTPETNAKSSPAAEPMVVQDVEDPKKLVLTPSDYDETSNQSDSIPLPSSSRSTPQNSSTRTPPEPEKEMTRAELFELFKDILREKNISSTSSWENALKYLANEPRFERFRTHPERKQFFNSYKVQRVKEEKEELKAKVRKAKDTLDAFLRSSERMNSILSYRRACEIFRDHDAWKIIPDSDRRSIFEDVSKDISRKEREASKVKRERNMQVLADILNSMISITARTTWQEAQHLLLDNMAFASDQELLSMDKEDALTTFEDHIRQLEKDENEEKERERKVRRRNERHNREAFIELLDELHRVGKLNSLSKWKNLFPEISADSRFEPMLGQPLSGSTPLDLFKFYVEDLKARYEDEKALIKDILRANKDFVIEPKTTYAEFVEILSKDPRSAKLDCGNVKMMYEKLSAREKEKQKEQQREVLKKKKRLESMFIDLLNTIDPPVNEHSRWEDVRQLLVGKPAFEAIETEEEREQMFLAAINSMMEACQHHHGPRVKHKSCKNDKKRGYRSPSSSSSASSDSRSSSSKIQNDPLAQRRSDSQESSTSSPVVSRSKSISQSPVYDERAWKKKKSKKSTKDRHRDEGEIDDDDDEEGEIRASTSRSTRDHGASRNRRGGSRDYVALPPASGEYRKSRRTPSRSPVPSRYYREERRSGKSPVEEKNGSSSHYDDHHRRGGREGSRSASSSRKYHRKSPSTLSDSKRVKNDDVGDLEELQLQRQLLLKQLGKKA